MPGRLYNKEEMAKIVAAYSQRAWGWNEDRFKDFVESQEEEPHQDTTKFIEDTQKRLDHSITVRELYGMVDRYYAEVQEDDDEPSVGDFVDYVASQEEGPGIRVGIDMAKEGSDHTVYYCTRCERYIPRNEREDHTHIDKPVLPEELHIHQSQDVKDPDTLLDILLDIQGAINDIGAYLKERRQ